MIHTIIFIQAVYYLATGLWPLIDIGSFQAVTGPKTDIWLVKTVGMLVMAVGAAFLVSYRNRSYPWPVVIMAFPAAAGFIGIEVYYMTAGTISPIYAADAVLEAVYLGAWLWIARQKMRRRRIA